MQMTPLPHPQMNCIMGFAKTAKIFIWRVKLEEHYSDNYMPVFLDTCVVEYEMRQARPSIDLIG